MNPAAPVTAAREPLSWGTSVPKVHVRLNASGDPRNSRGPFKQVRAVVLVVGFERALIGDGKTRFLDFAPRRPENCGRLRRGVHGAGFEEEQRGGIAAKQTFRVLGKDRDLLDLR